MNTPFTLPPDYGPDWNNQAMRLTALRNMGFNPRNILDVGAYHGYWAGLAKHIWPAAETLSIEANEDCREKLASWGRPFEIAVLSDTAEEKIYNKCETGCGEGNSLLKENSVFPFKEVKVQTKTLDSIVGENIYDFIKIDCQGHELPILEGAHWKMVTSAKAILLECQIQNYNEGAPNIQEVINQMNNYGFRVYDIIDFHYNSKSMLIQVDLLFLQTTSPLFKFKVLS